MEGFRFFNPEHFVLLLALPAIYYFYKFQKSRSLQKLEKFYSKDKFNFLLKNYNPKKDQRALNLQLIGLVFLIFALARPQTTDGVIKVKNEGSEIILMVDVSQSMLAQDLKPNRLEIAKKELSRLVDMSAGDRFGLIAFAGSAVLLSPVTADRDAIKMYIESLSTDTVSTQGTNIVKALQVAERSIVEGSSSDPNQLETVVSQSIIIASDGEAHDQGALDKVKELVEKKIKIFTLAFGTLKGAPIPVYDRSGQMRGYLTDRQGQTVLSQVKGDALKAIAEAGDGDFYQFSFDQDTMKALTETLSRLEKAKYSEGELKTYGELYYIFLPIAFAFLTLGITLSRTKKSIGKWRGRFETVN